MMRVFSVENDQDAREIHVPIDYADSNDRLYLDDFEALKAEISKFQGIDPIFEKAKPGPSTNKYNVSKYTDDKGKEYIQLW